MPDINSGSGDDTINVINGSGTLNGDPRPSPVTGIDSGSSEDVITVDNSNIDGSSGGSGNVVGGSGDDQISIQNGSSISGDVEGESGSDTILVTDSTVNGRIDSGNSGDVVILSGATIVGDVDMGSSGDTLNILGNTSIDGGVDGGSGGNTLNLPAGTEVNDSSGTSFTVVEGVSYTLPGESGTFLLPNGELISYVDFEDGVGLACFTRGVLIDTQDGPRAIETLQVGDAIETSGNATQEIRWIGRRLVSRAEMQANPNFYPVRIMAGALGAGLPERDMLVSRQHRMLVRSKIAERISGTSEVLVAAIRLTALPGIFVDTDVEEIEYFHLLFDRHEVIFAEGTPSESLFIGPEALRAMSAQARAEICGLFPEVSNLDYAPEPARMIPAGKTQKHLVRRHVKNNMPLLAGV